MYGIDIFLRVLASTHCRNVTSQKSCPQNVGTYHKIVAITTNTKKKSKNKDLRAKTSLQKTLFLTRIKLLSIVIETKKVLIYYKSIIKRGPKTSALRLKLHKSMWCRIHAIQSTFYIVFQKRR